MDIKTILSDEAKFKEIVTEGFKSVDTNNSGVIELPEFTKAIREITTNLSTFQSPTEDDIKSFFKDLDLDKSNTLTENEFAIFLRSIMEQMLPPEERNK